MKLHPVTLGMFVTLTAIDAQQPATNKPPVGVPADATLFNAKWYRLYLEKTTWTAARQKCERLGGQLAVIPDEPTQAFIKDFSQGLFLWLGATDEKVEGQWIWVDGTPMKFKRWYPGDPNNGRSANALALWENGTWADAPGNSKAVVGFICEWKAK